MNPQLHKTWPLIAAIWLLAALVPVVAPAATNAGREFYIAFMPNLGAQTHYLQIAATGTDAGVSLQVPGGVPQAYSLSADGHTRVELLPYTMNPSSDSISRSAVRLTSTSAVVVTAVNQASFSVDGALALPTTVWGTDYRILSAAQRNGQPSQFIVVASQDQTLVTVTPSASTGARVENVPYTITLNQGETYLLQTDDDGETLAGSEIRGDKPVGVFSGNSCAYVPTNAAYCSHLFEQLVPDSAAGSRFFVAPIGSREGSQLTIYALEEIALTTSPPIPFPSSLTRGSVTTIDVSAHVYAQIVANGRMIVTQSPQIPDGGSSFTTILPTVENFQDRQVLVPIGGGQFRNFARLTIPAADAANCTVNGGTMPSQGFPIGTSGYVSIEFDLGQVPAVVACTQPFGSLVYGLGLGEIQATYGYPGGMLVREAGAPVANAGVDISGEERSALTLDGTGSHDPAGTPLTFEWNQVSPAEPRIVLDLANPARPRFVGPEVAAPTNFLFSLVVTNSAGVASEPDFVNVTINDIGLPPPVAGCATNIVDIVGLRTVLSGTMTSRQTIALLDATLRAAQNALANDRKATARGTLALFLVEVVVASSLDPRIAGRIPIQDANALTCGAANVITRIAPR